MPTSSRATDGADDLGAQAEDVHVVVLDRLVGAVEVVADRGPDARQLAGRDRGARPRAADEDPALGLAALQHLPDLAGLVRVVDPHLGGVGAEVDHVVVGRALRAPPRAGRRPGGRTRPRPSCATPSP